MNKISYEELAVEVEELYAVEFDEKESVKINEHCEYIAQVIEARGWKIEEYLQAYIASTPTNLG